MNIAIDVTPLNDNRLLSHKVRGTGFYIQNLKKSLLEFFPENNYQFFTREDKLEKNSETVHYPYFEPFFLTLPFSKKLKTVVTVHDLTPLVFPEHFPSGIKGKIKWQIQKQNLLRSDRIITDSESSKKDITKFTGYPEKKIDVVYLAAGDEFRKFKIEDLRLKKNDIKLKYNLPEKFVLYVGDVTWNKNLPRLIKAVSKTDIPLVMVGKALAEKNYDRSNPWNSDLLLTQELISKNPNIKVLGFIPTDDLVSIYNSASIFVMPSLYEGFGLPILEAMQSGCPVITTKEGSLEEVAGNAAYYVDAKNTDSISDGISEVFENSKLQNELSAKGIEQAKKFSWKKTATETIRAYDKALKE
ncbi:MAG TPA: glycosyltransferase family 1 protein [Candidatus Limnocylindrales bacterium]|nr:glycosyltransferase family 1 protein [Candidatus Limnocylindrales bacterium]